jgi:hypothetical protein
MMTSTLNTVPETFWLIIIILLWVLPWKGYALWLAVGRKQTMWFIVLLVINTFSILELIYIFGIVKKKPKEIWESLNLKL